MCVLKHYSTPHLSLSVSLSLSLPTLHGTASILFIYDENVPTPRAELDVNCHLPITQTWNGNNHHAFKVETTMATKEKYIQHK